MYASDLNVYESYATLLLDAIILFTSLLKERYNSQRKCKTGLWKTFDANAVGTGSFIRLFQWNEKTQILTSLKQSEQKPSENRHLKGIKLFFLTKNLHNIAYD